MNLWEKKKLVLICFLIVVGVGISLYTSPHFLAGEKVEELKQEQVQPHLPPPVLVSVYISGAVKKPGIYDVPAGMRAIEAIKLAGGVTSEAAVHKVNMAKKCKDGLHIHVPFLSPAKGKRTQQDKPISNETVARNGLQQLGQTAPLALTKTKIKRKLNLHTATKQELQKLKGIGPALAQAIITYRTTTGFSCLEDLLKVPGIGQAKFKRLKDELEV